MQAGGAGLGVLAPAGREGADGAALLLLLGSAFYQSLFREYGWSYALLATAEGLLLIWWGSARRQRRFLYVGLVGVVAAVGGQIAKQVFAADAHTWVILGVPGLILLALYVIIERNLETIKRVSPELWKRLQEWE